MKNWKYIEGAKVGNESIASHPESLVAQEIYKIYLDAGKDENKALETLYTKYKSIPKEALKKHLKDAIKAYASIVRNSKAGNIAADITTDGNTWFVTTSDGKKKEFPSEREAEAYVKKIKTGNGVFSIFKSDKPIKMKSPQGAIVTINPDGTAAHQDKEGSQMAVHPHNSFKEAVEYYKSQGYVKVSNESLGEYMAKKPRVINEEKTGAEEFFKKLSDDVKEREDKDEKKIDEVGNASTGDFVALINRALKIAKENPEKASRMNQIVSFLKSAHNLPTNKWQYHIDRIGKELDEVGNKVGNANLEASVEKGKLGLWNWYVHKDGTIVSGGTSSTETNAKEMARKALEKEKAANKVGNARYTTREDVISHLDTDLYDICKKIPSGTTPWAYLLELQKKGWDMNTISKYSKEIGKIVEKYKAQNAKTGNSKFGNAAATFFIIAPNGEKVKAIDYDQWHYKCVDTGELVEKRFSKRIGNSASDDKFAYVMREFDEGKLKTPDGKVVTDPAQAKAIAYSESKKTENGLARARNAMAKNWNSDRNINPVGAYKEFIANLKNAIELGVAAVTYNIDGSTLKTWVDQAKKEGYGSHISGIQGQKVILK